MDEDQSINIAAFDRFTPRRWEVILLVLKGFNYPAVGKRLHIAVRTVRYHMEEAYEALNITADLMPNTLDDSVVDAEDESEENETRRRCAQQSLLLLERSYNRWKLQKQQPTVVTTTDLAPTRLAEQGTIQASLPQSMVEEHDGPQLDNNAEHPAPTSSTGAIAPIIRWTPPSFIEAVVRSREEEARRLFNLHELILAVGEELERRPPPSPNTFPILEGNQRWSQRLHWWSMRTTWFFQRHRWFWFFTTAALCIVVVGIIAYQQGIRATAGPPLSAARDTDTSSTDAEVPSPARTDIPAPTHTIAATVAISPTIPAIAGGPDRTITPTGSSSAAPALTACGESQQTPASLTVNAVEGMILILPENTEQALPSHRARTLTITKQGVWTGFFAVDDQQGGVSYSDKKTWAKCAIQPGNVNDIITDPQGRVWVAFESDGVAMYDGQSWHHYTPATNPGLPSPLTFGFTIDPEGMVLVATHEGIARYNGAAWETIYNGENKTIYFNSTHTIAFDRTGNIWVGHISEGVSVYWKETGKWDLLQAPAGLLGGNKIRAIHVQQRDNGEEAVWFATADGGLSVYADKQWKTYGLADGLPSTSIQDVTEDPLGRIWVATESGVSYLRDGRWVRYHSFPARSIAFGCEGCPYDEDQVLTATWDHGVTYTRLPYPQDGATVTEICFEVVARTDDCHSYPPVTWEDGQPTVTLTYPTTLLPGQRFQMKMFLAPTTPYTFSAQRGDKLNSLDPTTVISGNEKTIYGTFIQIAPLRDVASAEPYRFADDNNPFVAPELLPGETEHVFTSHWRMWMHTRYSGPIINLRFKVVASVPLPTPTPN